MPSGLRRCWLSRQDRRGGSDRGAEPLSSRRCTVELHRRSDQRGLAGGAFAEALPPAKVVRPTAWESNLLFLRLPAASGSRGWLSLDDTCAAELANRRYPGDGGASGRPGGRYLLGSSLQGRDAK